MGRRLFESAAPGIRQEKLSKITNNLRQDSVYS
jgi:hypothetical protein